MSSVVSTAHRPAQVAEVRVDLPAAGVVLEREQALPAVRDRLLDDRRLLRPESGQLSLGGQHRSWLDRLADLTAVLLPALPCLHVQAFRGRRGRGGGALAPSPRTPLSVRRGGFYVCICVCVCRAGRIGTRRDASGRSLLPLPLGISPGLRPRRVVGGLPRLV